MPTIDIYNGLKISINSGDHNPPHFHVENSQEDEALIRIDNADIIKGYLPANYLKRFYKWYRKIDIHAFIDYFYELNPDLRNE